MFVCHLTQFHLLFLGLQCREHAENNLRTAGSKTFQNNKSRKEGKGSQADDLRDFPGGKPSLKEHFKRFDPGL